MDDTTTATEVSESLTENEGETNVDVNDTDIRVPKFRLDQEISKRRETESKIEVLEKQLAELSKAQPQKVEQTQEGKKFKDAYTSIDEFYSDITKQAASDDAFLDKLLDALYEKRGDKFDEVLFNSLTRKNQKVMQEQEDINTRLEREQDEKLDNIEANFGTDVAGFAAFKDWVTETLSKYTSDNVPVWAKDIDDLYSIFKEYKYQAPAQNQNTAAKKISRSKVGGKIIQKPDLDGDFFDVVKKMNVFE